MKLTPVATSTNISAYGYDAETQVLVVRFKGGVYRYSNVSDVLYAGLTAAPSKGRYLAAHVTRNAAHKAEKLPPEAVEALCAD